MPEHGAYHPPGETNQPKFDGVELDVQETRLDPSPEVLQQQANRMGELMDQLDIAITAAVGAKDSKRERELTQ